MTLHRRLALACALAVAVVVVLGSVVAYVLVRANLRGEVDGSLRVAARRLAAGPPGAAAGSMLVRDPLDGPTVAFALQGPQVDFTAAAPGPALPVDPGAAEVGAGERGPYFADREIDGVHARVFVSRAENGLAAVVARPLTEVDAVLGRLRLGLGAIVLVGILASTLLARLVARTALRPVAVLTDTAEHVARTRDLSRRIDGGPGGDELSRLAGAFNTMLAALERSQRSQRQLVADASHELRTPLTSLRTNLEVLSEPALPAADRERLRADVVAELEGLSLLVGDLVDLARDEQAAPVERCELRLDELVVAAVERARRHAPGVRFDVDVQECVLDGYAARIDRAVANLLDNAAKFGGGHVEVSLRGGELSVRDHGPGIAPDELPLVFERFWRSPSARSQPGSGLGLAIVRQVAALHGGAATAQAAGGGGALLRVRFSPSS